MIDAKSIKRVLDWKTLKLPRIPKVVDVQIEVIEDSTGDTALDVTVILAENTPDDDRGWNKAEPIEQAIHDRLRKRLSAKGLDLWPYFRFVKQSELRQAANWSS